MKHTDDYYIKRIKKILWDHFSFHSWCTPKDRGVYITSLHFVDWIKWFEERSLEVMYVHLKYLTTLDILKLKAMAIRRWYDNTYWYVDEKFDSISLIKSDCDAYIIWNMFDIHNQKKLLEHLTEDEIKLIWENNIKPFIPYMN